MLNFTNYSCCCSFSKLCPTLWNPMGCSMSGSSVLYYLPEFAQTHIHWVTDAIQPSHALSSPSPPALNLSHYQGFSKELALCIRWPKYWSFSFRNSPSNEYSVDFLWIDCFDFLAVQGTLKSVLQQPDSKTSILPSQTLLWSNFPMNTWLLEKP